MLVMAIGHIDWYTCAYRNCNRPSVQRKGVGPKRTYCPPKGKGSESLCARLERYHRRVSVVKEDHEKYLNELHERIYGEAYGTDRDKSALKDSQRRT